MKLRSLALGSIAAFALVACASPQSRENGTAPDPQDLPAIAAMGPEESAGICVGAGPQTPRDITNKSGLNSLLFDLAPPPQKMNLCNIHAHKNAEHKGPGFSLFVNSGETGGYACNDRDSLTEDELADPFEGKGAFKGVAPGDTIEVHWVYTSCDTAPGQGLGACAPETCSNPTLRVEAQTFLVVNDPNALDINSFDFTGDLQASGFHQPGSLPKGTGDPVVFRGSTTGPSYSQSTCSPLQVTWSVRPQCARVDISSLHEWAAKGNVFNESEAHGVRQLVTAPELLAPIE
ncbi:MAG: delta-class carbonic anhydrase [Hyphomonas sp.]|uniref:delta-class carbonic anhydrase n=1 Tax=Hyphomonas sp. TaxID=87 RepID=UPI003003A21F